MGHFCLMSFAVTFNVNTSATEEMLGFVADVLNVEVMNLIQ